MHDDVRICYIGDSLVNGTGDRQMLGWTGRVSASANSAEFIMTHYNLGIRGNTSEDILNRWKTEFERRKVDTADCRLVFSFGVNDTVMENGKTRVIESVSLMNARSIMHAASDMANPFWIGPTPVDNDEQNNRIRKLSDQFNLLAKDTGVDYLPVYSSLISNPIWREEVRKGDGSHPDSAGYTVLSELILNAPIWRNFITA